MTAPLFIRIRTQLLNVASVSSARVEDEYLYVNCGGEDVEFEFETTAEAGRALDEIQKLLEERGLFLGRPI
jgi:hypothetical protein